MSRHAARILLACLPAVLAVTVRAQTSNYKIAPPGKWVIQHDLEGQRITDTACLQWGEEILLLDRQYDLAGQQVYWRYATHLISTEGVQNGSRFEVAFDPTYQQLTIHHLRIVRNGQVIDQLKDTPLRVLHREEDLSSHLYDGSLTVVGEMHDVRVGDVVDYALSIRGWNPVDRGRFHKYLPMGYRVPVARCYTRIMIPAGRTPLIMYHGAVEKPMETLRAGSRELSWDLGPLDCIRVDDNVPGWHSTYPGIDISEFATVEELRDWAMEQYDLDQPISRELADRIAAIRSIDDVYERLDSAVDLVQREVRYLGLEDGISAYRPHAPSRVFEQRYGDCKDKSFLLVTILRGAGLEAYPALVGTGIGRSMDAWLPRPSLFDHCITMIPIDGDTLWADATSRHNGGRGLNRYTPNFGKALVVGKGFEGYTPMTVRDTGSVDVLERFVLDSVGGPSELHVEAIYRGRRADGMRSELASGSLHDLAKGYRDFYAGIYGPCEELESLRFDDDVRTNVLHTYEKYRLDQPWDTIDDGRTFSFNVTAYHIRDHQTKPGRSVRTAPYYLGEPLQIRHRITVELPEPWTVSTGTVDHMEYGIEYSKNISVEDDRIVTLDYRYSSVLPEIPAQDAFGLQDLQELIADDLYFEFTRPIDGTQVANTDIGWGKWFFILFCIAVCAFGALRLYRFDPPPHPEALGKADRSIGSFLLLPAIGLCLTPFRFLYDFFSDDASFFHATDYAEVASPENPLFADLTIHLGQFMAFAQFALVLLLLVLFFGRRTSAPLLMKVMYGTSFLWLVMDYMIYQSLDFDTIIGEPYPYRDLSRAFFAACVWIPVFHFSGRVHATFTKRLNGPDKGLEQLSYMTGPTAEVRVLDQKPPLPPTV